MYWIPELNLYLEKYGFKIHKIIHIQKHHEARRTCGQKIRGSLPDLAAKMLLLPRFHGKARERVLDIRHVASSRHPTPPFAYKYSMYKPECK